MFFLPKGCRFNFGKFFCDRTIVAEPLSALLSDQEKTEILQWRKIILDKVQHYINTFLNPAKSNFYDPTREDYSAPKTIDEILTELEISKTDYDKALSISDDKSDFQLHLKRPPNSCFINNYFKDGILAWEANMDIQPVFNHYKAITYMCAYLSETEDECFLAMNQAAKEAF